MYKYKNLQIFTILYLILWWIFSPVFEIKRLNSIYFSKTNKLIYALYKYDYEKHSKRSCFKKINISKLVFDTKNKLYGEKNDKKNI